MDERILNSLGYWFLGLVSSIIIFISYFIGHMANGLDVM
ncbi:unnamed protein product, partial [marine sediment metagenome]